MEDHGAERRDIRVVIAAYLVEHVGAAIDLWVPQRRSAFGRYAACHDLVQTAEHRIGQHVADRVASGDRAWPLDIEQTSVGRAGGSRDRRPHDGVPDLL